MPRESGAMGSQNFEWSDGFYLLFHEPQQILQILERGPVIIVQTGLMFKNLLDFIQMNTNTSVIPTHSPQVIP